VTATGGTAPYTYSWNTTPVQTSCYCTGLAAGTYTVTITECGWLYHDKLLLRSLSQLLPGSQHQGYYDVNCFGGTTGSAYRDRNCALRLYVQLEYYAGPDRASASGLAAAGTYTVTNHRCGGCTTNGYRYDH